VDLNRFGEIPWGELKKKLWKHRILQRRLFLLLSEIPVWRKQVRESFYAVLSGKKIIRENEFLLLTKKSSYEREKERLERFFKRYGERNRVLEGIYLSRRLEMPLKKVKKFLSPALYLLQKGESDKLPALVGLPQGEAERVLREAEKTIREIITLRHELYRAVALLGVSTVTGVLGSFSEDAFQRTYEGFVKAVELYRPYKGNRFSTYLTYWFQQSVRRYLEKERFLIRPPANRLEEGEDCLSLSYVGPKELPELSGILKSSVPSPEEELVAAEERKERIERGRKLMSFLHKVLPKRKFNSLVRALEREDYEKVREIVLSEISVDIIQQSLETEEIEEVKSCLRRPSLQPLPF